MLRRLDPKNTALFVCDIQEKFRKVMPLFQGLIKNTNKMLLAAKELEIPVIMTEQYPKGLGKIVKDLNVCDACSKFEKTRLSMWIPEVKQKLQDKYEGKPCDVLLCGLETHACVEQTAVDLMENDINVYLLADCVCSRTLAERDLAIERLRHAGCIISTSENAIFWLLQDKDHPKFEIVRKLLKSTSAEMSLTPNTIPKKEKNDECPKEG